MTIYLPDDIEKEARRRARKARKSLSAFFAGLLGRGRRPRRWPESFERLYGSCELGEVESLPVDERDPM